jgi:hypothetical protein
MSKQTHVTARPRSPAYFTLDTYSSAFQESCTWRIRISETGILARRQDGRELSISWRTLLGAAMVYGKDSQGVGPFNGDAP